MKKKLPGISLLSTFIQQPWFLEGYDLPSSDNWRSPNMTRINNVSTRHPTEEKSP